MSTRSNIGIINRNGTVEMVYCHSDGYPSYNGSILLENYSNEEKLRELLALGDLSVLRENIGEQHKFDDYETGSKNRWTVAYGRDRGETDVNCRKVRSANSSLKQMEEYLYLWDCKTNSWIFSDHGGGFKPLTPAECKD
jgi:hypothetical protein